MKSAKHLGGSARDRRHEAPNRGGLQKGEGGRLLLRGLGAPKATEGDGSVGWNSGEERRSRPSDVRNSRKKSVSIDLSGEHDILKEIATLNDATESRSGNASAAIPEEEEEHSPHIPEERGEAR